MTEEEQSVLFEIEMRKTKGGDICQVCEGTGRLGKHEVCDACLGQGIQLTDDEFDLMVRLDDSILDAEFIF